MAAFKLEYKDRYGDVSEIDRFEDSANDIQELQANNLIFYNLIKDFIYRVNPQYKIYYYRHWINEDNKMVVDVGSHIEFFYVSKVEV